MTPHNIVVTPILASYGAILNDTYDSYASTSYLLFVQNYQISEAIIPETDQFSFERLNSMVAARMIAGAVSNLDLVKCLDHDDIASNNPNCMWMWRQTWLEGKTI